ARARPRSSAGSPSRTSAPAARRSPRPRGLSGTWRGSSSAARARESRAAAAGGLREGYCRSRTRARAIVVPNAPIRHSFGPEQQAEEGQRKCCGQAETEAEQPEPLPEACRALSRPRERPLDPESRATREEHGDQAKQGSGEGLARDGLRQVDVLQA